MLLHPAGQDLRSLRTPSSHRLRRGGTSVGVFGSMHSVQFSRDHNRPSYTERPGGVLKRLKENKKAARFHKQPSPWSVENRSWLLTAPFILVPPVEPRP